MTARLERLPAAHLARGPGLVAAAFGIDPAEVRLRRQELLDRAAPQRGVDALKHHFTGTTPIPGVQDLGPPTSSADGPDGSVPGETEREGQS